MHTPYGALLPNVLLHPMKLPLSSIFRWIRNALLTVLVIAAGGGAAWLASQRVAVSTPPSPPPPSEGESILRLDERRVSVPRPMAERIGLVPPKDKPVATVKQSADRLILPLFQGTLALDSNSLQRIHSRFAGEIVALGVAAGSGEAAGPSSFSPGAGMTGLKTGDRITAGQLLAVVWSKELGEKKSELVDAVSKLKLDVQVAGRLRDLYKQNATAEKAVLDAERAVESDRIAVDRIERTLLSWRLTEADLARARAEADKIGDPGATRSTAADWARVEIRAAQAGVLLEKNVGVGDIVDTTADLFKIGNLSSLTVWAHLYEDDLHLLAGIALPAEWTVVLPSNPRMPPLKGRLEQIGSVIDPNQHTALVSGSVENPEGKLKIGQAVTVSLTREPDRGELTVPTEALIEDGKGSFVFVQPDPAHCVYERRTVSVLRRTRDLVYLKGVIPGSIREGDRVIGPGAILLNEAMNAAAMPSAK